METVLVFLTYCSSVSDFLTAVPELKGKIRKVSCSR